MINERITHGPIIKAVGRKPAIKLTLAEPTPAEMAVDVTKAAATWIAAGLPVVNQPTYDARAAACAGCELWDAKARFGLGKCKACGCTKLKLHLATERCKHPAGSRWPAVP